MNSHEVFIHIHQGCFAGTGAIVRLPQCQWSKPDGYGKISQCITTTKHSKAKTVCIFLGIYCKIARFSPKTLWEHNTIRVDYKLPQAMTPNIRSNMRVISQEIPQQPIKAIKRPAFQEYPPPPFPLSPLITHTIWLLSFQDIWTTHQLLRYNRPKSLFGSLCTYIMRHSN